MKYNKNGIPILPANNPKAGIPKTYKYSKDHFETEEIIAWIKAGFPLKALTFKPLTKTEVWEILNMTKMANEEFYSSEPVPACGHSVWEKQ